MSAISHLEAVEQEALAAWFRSATARSDGAFLWKRFRCGDADCYLSATEPSILVNRVLSLGSEMPPTLEMLRDLRAAYSDAGIRRFFLHVLPDRLGPGYEQLLVEAGFEKYRGWMKFERGAGAVKDAPTDLDIREIGPDSADDFARIVADAFDFTPAFRPALASLADAPGWRLYMSFDGATPAGTGGLFVGDGVGYLDFGSTHPDFRRRGGQAALLSTRVRDALDAGCRSIVTMTGEAVAGEEQHSYRNIQRAGFHEACLRENWIPGHG